VVGLFHHGDLVCLLVDTRLPLVELLQNLLISHRCVLRLLAAALAHNRRGYELRVTTADRLLAGDVLRFAWRKGESILRGEDLLARRNGVVHRRLDGHESLRGVLRRLVELPAVLVERCRSVVCEAIEGQHSARRVHSLEHLVMKDRGRFGHCAGALL
jgi:hypothetical protein